MVELTIVTSGQSLKITQLSPHSCRLKARYPHNISEFPTSSNRIFKTSFMFMNRLSNSLKHYKIIDMSIYRPGPPREAWFNSNNGPRMLAFGRVIVTNNKYSIAYYKLKCVSCFWGSFLHLITNLIPDFGYNIYRREWRIWLLQAMTPSCYLIPSKMAQISDLWTPRSESLRCGVHL